MAGAYFERTQSLYEPRAGLGGAQMLHQCAGLWEQAVHPLNVSDDRLAEVVRRLSLSEVSEPLEQQTTQRMVRVYELPGELVRLDTTTAKVYGGDDLSVLFQRGHSKDHRPDLRQLKVMLAALDPLGVLVGADIVSGNTADDGLYVPMIARLRSTLPPKGLLYIGDCKMGALATRAYVAQTYNAYLMPLAQLGDLPEQLENGWTMPCAARHLCNPYGRWMGKHAWAKPTNIAAA